MTIASLRAAITRLDETLQLAEGSEHAGLDLSARSLRNLRNDLENQLLAARRSEVELHLSGQPVDGHEIRIDKLARFLGKFQEAVASTAQALTGKATSRAPIPASLRNASSLQLAGVFPGSFGATLRGPEQDNSQEVLFELDNENVESLLDLSLKRILLIIDAASRDAMASEEAIVELVAPLGSRALSHLKWLAKLMSDDELDAEWVWTAQGSSSKHSELTHLQARGLYRVLNNNDATEDIRIVRGLLGGASELRNRIELQISSGEIITARVVDDVVPALRDYFGSEVHATFNIKTVVSRTSNIVRNYYLLTDLDFAVSPGQGSG